MYLKRKMLRLFGSGMGLFGYYGSVICLSQLIEQKHSQYDRTKDLKEMLIQFGINLYPHGSLILLVNYSQPINQIANK